MTRSYVELTLPAWAVLLATDLLSHATVQHSRPNAGGGLQSFRFGGESFERLDIEADLIRRRLPFDLHRQEATAGNPPCRGAERRVRFNAEGSLAVDLEDIPSEMGNVYIGLLETVRTSGEREAVDAFLRAARKRDVVEPLSEAVPLPEQISALRNTEELVRMAGLRQRRVL